MTGETLVEPTNVTKIPWFEMRVPQTPRGHLLNRPLGRGLMIRRTCQPRTVNVREHVLGLHDLGVVRFFLADALE